MCALCARHQDVCGVPLAVSHMHPIYQEVSRGLKGCQAIARGHIPLQLLPTYAHDELTHTSYMCLITWSAHCQHTARHTVGTWSCVCVWSCVCERDPESASPRAYARVAHARKARKAELPLESGWVVLWHRAVD